MPIYDYECTHCGHKFEVFQKITAEPLKDICPKCSFSQLKRLIGSGGGIIFSRHNRFYASGRDPARKLISETGKGPGFYATDYRSKDYKKKEKEETKPKSSTTPNPR